MVDKPILRRAMLTRRQALSMEERQRASAIFAERFLAEYAHQKAAVAGYFSIKGELDVMPLLHQLCQQGWQCALPVMHENSRMLQFRQWLPETLLQKGKYAIPEPSVNAAIIQPGIILVPLVAYNMAGYRLGYGGGYYDATLPQYPDAQHVGCAYQWQLQEFMPESHDAKLQRIIAV